MGVNLAKKEKVSLEKSGGLSRIFMGLGWDMAKPKASGFFGKMLGSSSDSEDIDLDASCLMLDANKKIVDTVWFHQLKSNDGSVVHKGDNLTGAGDGDDEVITVDLTHLPSNVTNLVFVISSFRGQTFDKIEAAFCRLVDATKNTELARYQLSGKNSSTAQIMAQVYKENGAWTMQAIGESTNGRTVQDFADQVKNMV
ncbi:TerD family protein [archaeon]|nr:TerD family protein [archaeon]